MVTRRNANAASIFEWLYRVTAIGRSYFGKLNEDMIKSNFVLIYELLDGKTQCYLLWFHVPKNYWILAILKIATPTP